MKKHPQTAILHPDYQPPSGFAAFPVPVQYASTVIFDNVAAMRSRLWQDKTGYTYGLHGTPTTFILEAQLAQIEGGTHCLLVPSGLAAISVVDFALLKSGDEVLIPDNAYYSNTDLGHWLMERFGVISRIYDPLIGAGIAELIGPNTRLIWTEAPGSVSMEVPDIPAICQAAHERGVLVALDNTWSAGITFHPFEHGVDISIQALTKYQSGGSDVLMGAVITRDRSLYDALSTAHMRLGFGVGVDDVYRVLRSLPTLALRMEAHARNAQQVACWLATRPEVARILHPAFPDCPGHDLWKRDFHGSGGLFSVVLDERYAQKQVDQFVDHLQIFKLGFSWGGANSLCVPYDMTSCRTYWTEEGCLVRFYVGLEDPTDLIADIEQAWVFLLGSL